MASYHFRHASVNTAFEPPDGSLSPFPRSRTPLGHRRGRSLATAEKGTFDAQPLLFVEDTSDEKDPVEIKTVTPALPARRSNRYWAGLWILSLFVTWYLTYTLSQSTTKLDPLGTFATGYSTELRNARPQIHLKKEQFHGSLDFKDRYGFIPPSSPSMKYVGANADVDAAWEELTDGRYFLLTDEEAHDAYGASIDQYWNVHHGGYVAGLDVLHTLHCLNHLRMSIYPTHYPQDPRHGQMHKAHCIDHMRQLAMCQADLTPVPTQWFDGLSRNYINSSREHTCRDFWQVRDWATERFNGSLAVKPRNRDGTEREEFYAPWTP